MGQARRVGKIRGVEAERTWDAVVRLVTARATEDGLKPDIVDVTMENVKTPGVNNYGMMVFEGISEVFMYPSQDVKSITLKERSVQGITSI